jgi:hypothetical protein
MKSKKLVHDEFQTSLDESVKLLFDDLPSEKIGFIESLKNRVFLRKVVRSIQKTSKQWDDLLRPFTIPHAEMGEIWGGCPAIPHEGGTL